MDSPAPKRMKKSHKQGRIDEALKYQFLDSFSSIFALRRVAESKKGQPGFEVIFYQKNVFFYPHKYLKYLCRLKRLKLLKRPKKEEKQMLFSTLKEVLKEFFAEQDQF